MTSATTRRPRMRTVAPAAGPTARRHADPAVRLSSVTKVYDAKGNAVHALRGVTLDVPVGSFIAVMGPSGSGKSTLLQVAAGLDRPTSGRVLLGTQDLGALGERDLTLARRERIGFVFQAFNLVPALTAEQNVALPLRLAGRRPSRRQVSDVLARVGLAAQARRRPSELSGGQQQRVAIARALIIRPEVLFADEPTGALDTTTGRAVLGLVRELVDAAGQTVVMVTHDPAAAAHADWVVFLADGRLAGELTTPTPEAIAERLARLGG